MEEILRIKAFYNRMHKHNDKIYFYTKNTRIIKVYDLITGKSRTLQFKSKVTKISSTNDRIMVFRKDRVNFMDPNGLSRLTKIVYPGIQDLICLGEKNYIFFNKSNAYFSDAGKSFIVKKLIYYQIDRNYAILVLEDRIAIYEENILHPIYEIHKNEFIKKFLIGKEDAGYNIFNNYEDVLTDEYSLLDDRTSLISENMISAWDNNIHFSIRKNKLYTKYDQRIWGPDLNLYLDDLSSISTVKYDVFTNIPEQIILFSNQGELLIMEKNLVNNIFKAHCKDYIYDEVSEKLFLLIDGLFVIYRWKNIFDAPFQLIDTYVKYNEQEDEFDKSNSEIYDFNK